MAIVPSRTGHIISRGKLPFTVESRILRELGERLVKRPEVAAVELVKNSYDADATECTVLWSSSSIVVADNGSGMSLQRFRDGWMRIGTSIKGDDNTSERYRRPITGEKGIGRFAVRFLGRTLRLETVANDAELRQRTRLLATFDWHEFDSLEDLGALEIPYVLEMVDSDVATGTTLEIFGIRAEALSVNLNQVRTSSLGILSPLSSLFRSVQGEMPAVRAPRSRDPGFVLKLNGSGGDEHDVTSDVGAEILNAYVLRATVSVTKSRLILNVYRPGNDNPRLSIDEPYENTIGRVQADIRFFPRRKGSFVGLPLDGRRAHSWISANAGVAIFDRVFRVQPYGSSSDDWLRLQADAAQNRRSPRSSVAQKHLPMSEVERGSDAINWMLRLPLSAQLVGIVSVDARRGGSERSEGLVAAADREGFVENAAFEELRDVVRGAVEAIAYVDRAIQLEDEETRHKEQVKALRHEMRAAIREIEANPQIPAADKRRIVTTLTETQKRAEEQEASSRAREQQLEIMSLLGVLSGFLTHEFGLALSELDATQKTLASLARRDARFRNAAETLTEHIKRLRDFVAYSKGYVQGARVIPSERYPVLPRLQQVRRVFGQYAADRKIDVTMKVERSLLAPLVPPALYNGIALNLYTNALKAVTARAHREAKIEFRAWEEGRWHYLDVCDTGIGIPTPLQHRIFDPLFTTTDSRDDPLGSGMGLGLALVRRAVEAFNGRVDVVTPPEEFSTCIRVKLPV